MAISRIQFRILSRIKKDESYQKGRMIKIYHSAFFVSWKKKAERNRMKLKKKNQKPTEERWNFYE